MTRTPQMNSDHNLEAGSLKSIDDMDEETDEMDDDDLEYTVKDRQDAINIEHPFGLPIWKPALYKKSRSIQRTADSAIRGEPGLHPARSTLPGNICWLLFFGIWLSLLCLLCSMILYFIPRGGIMYSHTMWGLATYLLWPFGNYVEVECSHQGGHRHGPCRLPKIHEHEVKENDVVDMEHHHAGSSEPAVPEGQSSRYGAVDQEEAESPMNEQERIELEHKLYHYVYDDNGNDIGVKTRWGGIVVYAFVYGLLLFPALGLVCLLCWSLVVTIPMAKLLWVLIKNLASQPLALHFRSPLQIDTRNLQVHGSEELGSFRDVLHPGHMAPLLKRKHRKKGSSKRRSVILLCTYKAMGREYFKYTVGGINILFVDTIPIIFFTIILFYIVRPWALEHGATSGLFGFITSEGFIFCMALASVLPLSYFIGMAVASISTQSSIGMGAVINATFGSIIELILYGIALTENKGSLVEGSIVGSILAGVLLMPGCSMCSGALRRKEQRFNSRSAGVTSTMLIMAIIGILTPTLFYQIYGQFELLCRGCPHDFKSPSDSYQCQQCSYRHVPPFQDPFFQTNVKPLIYTCAFLLMLAYAIGLWFSLRTHASQIWNSAPTSVPVEHLPPHFRRASVYKQLFPNGDPPSHLPIHHTQSDINPNQLAPPSANAEGNTSTRSIQTQPQSSSNTNAQASGSKNKHQPDDLAMDVAAKVFQYLFSQQKSQSPENEGEASGNGGHDAPSWSRKVSLSVLFTCTFLYAIIAEIIVDMVDVVIKGSGLSAKFVGVTLFALVPNTTEFMNAMSFALNGNIALSLEIGSAYALQVCLIQIPVLVLFSAVYNYSYLSSPEMDLSQHSFTLIFPRWDIIAIIFSIFLLTYTYNESRSNYHRGSILVLSYLVFISGFFFAPSIDPEDPQNDTQVFSLAS
ncbi:hypothetical protein MNAN1_000880 [Malassezia nana]|uniref:Uncharacterized protein n=1 Tax=Malassezia nana TaxID=180528 RepID=A0AAF0J1C5_9BASI|nr:hypothetical protein MNAN1_000880 [Malassezia nana]